MLQIPLLIVGISLASQSQESLQDSLQKSMVVETDDLRMSPPVPLWPEGLPQAYLLTKGSVVQADGTFYPAPLDFVVNFHLAAWEQYPDQCQQRLSLAYEMHEHLYNAYEDQLREPALPAGPLKYSMEHVMMAGVIGAILGTLTTCAVIAMVNHE